MTSLDDQESAADPATLLSREAKNLLVALAALCARVDYEEQRRAPSPRTRGDAAARSGSRAAEGRPKTRT